jgi:hypothetical protein
MAHYSSLFFDHFTVWQVVKDKIVPVVAIGFVSSAHSLVRAFLLFQRLI